MLLVLVRSRPGSHAFEQRSPRRADRGSRGRPRRSPAARLPPPRARRACSAWCSAGSAPGGASRMRSMAARASAGRVSHVGERTSHSFGPRLPKSWMNRSKAAANSTDVGSSRDNAHIAWLGSAESTEPRPAMIGMIRSGRPTAVGDAADDAHRHRRHVRGEQVVGEQRAMQRQQRQVAIPQASVGHGRQVGSRVAEGDGLVAVVGQLGQIVERCLGEDPREGLADLLGEVRTNVALHRLVRRDARLRAEERLVHQLPAETRAPARRTAGSTTRSGSSSHPARPTGRTGPRGTRRRRTRPSAPTPSRQPSSASHSAVPLVSGVTGSGNTSPTFARVYSGNLLERSESVT